MTVAKKRTVDSLWGFFRLIGKKASVEINFVCSDMLPADIKVINKKAPQALNILGQFHIVAKPNAVDNARKAEVKSLVKEEYEPILKEGLKSGLRSRFLLAL